MADCLIWIVDDDPDDLYLMEQAFKECSFEVRTFNAPLSFELLSALEESHRKDIPKVLVLDINMPQVSGKELLAAIRKNPQFRHLPIVMFTTSNSRRDRIECLELGANCYITKPTSYPSMVKICSALATVFCMPEFATYK